MKTNFIKHLFLICLFILIAVAVQAVDESQLIQILQSNASIPDKCAACQQLRVLGTVKSVEVLASLLGEERTAHAARYALEGLPYPEAGAVLRQALGQAKGQIKAGIIDSLGWRGEPAGVALLTPLLTDTDATLVSAAACALGRIGNPEAIAALIALRPTASPALKPVVLEALLRSADRLMANKDNARAASIYRGIFDPQNAPPLRMAAWRGLVLSQVEGRGDLLLNALLGTDEPIRLVALKLIRECGDATVMKVCLSRWKDLPPEAQLAVLDAHLKLGAEALPTVRLACQSPNAAVRMAGWQSCAELNDSASLSALAKASASTEPAEREVARESLTRLHGPGIKEAFLLEIQQAETGVKAELLRALGERGEKDAAKVLLRNAAAAADPVRLAALESLRKLALPETLPPLLDLAGQSRVSTGQEALVRTLFAVCQASPDKDQAAQRVIDALKRFSPPARRQILPLLSDLGTPAALEAAQAATRDPDIEVVKAAVRVLTSWPNAAPAPRLLELANTSADSTLKTLAVRGCIEVLGQEPDLAKRLAMIQQAVALAQRDEEKKLALGQIGQIPTAEALQAITPSMSDPKFAEEAELAALTIAEKLTNSNPQLASEIAGKIVAQSRNTENVKRAWTLSAKAVTSGPFIQTWLVSGPYQQGGAVGATAYFDLVFDPEKAGASVKWQAMPPGDQLNLSALFPGRDNCVAYLKTQVTVPEETPARLLMGSDDGIKAWLNGAVVHGNNVDRGLIVDQDMASIVLKKGTNDLLLKVTQGGGGWAVCARVVGVNGQPLSAMKIVPLTGVPTAQAAPAPPPAAPVVPKPADLPQRDAFKTLRLSDQFYAEGAYYGDFNHDGKMDIVAGPFWFEGPTFEKKHEYRPVKVYDPKEYSDNFLTYTGDFNLDGWTDIFCVPFPGTDGFWYENPAGKDAPWKKHLACSQVGNESPVWGDITGDGQPELIYCINSYLGYASPNPSQPEQPWAFHAISTKDNRYQQFTHGVGFGDLNGDKRVDVLEAAGWWEQPANPQPDQPWIFHPFQFAEWAAQMLVYDVDGDGLADVVTAWHCHHYGLVWWQQVKSDSGQPAWIKHEILSATPDVTTTDFRVSQMHAFDLVDMNGDGLKDFVTGKRFWSHGPTGDKEPDAPAVVLWFELRRGAQGAATFTPHLIDDNSGVGTQVTAVDLNNDGRPDVVVANKKGIFVHLNNP